MEFHFRLMDVLPGLDSVGGFGLLQGWLVGFEVGCLDVQEAATILAHDLGS